MAIGIVNSADGNDDGDANDFGDAPMTGLPDRDRDDIADFRDLDSNADGIPDIKDALNNALDENNDGKVDDIADPDKDGIPNSADTKDTIFGGLPNGLADLDGDGLTDKEE